MTYGAMQSRIADELARSDLTTQIQRSIQTAIKKYERQRFYFNESVFAFSTADGRDTYSAGDHSTIANLVTIDSLRINRNAQSRYTLVSRPWEYLNQISANPSVEGAPTDYAYRGQHFRLYPIADATYSIDVACVIRLPALSADADTNAWMTDGEELIRTCAKHDLFTHVIRDYDEAAKLERLMENCRRALVAETNARDAARTTIAPSW